MAYVQYGEDDSAGATSVTLSVTNGNYIVAWAGTESDLTSPTISTSAGSTSSWTEVQSVVNGGDYYCGSLAYCTATATGSVTIQGSDESSWNGLIVVEIDSIDSYDSSAIARDTSGPKQSGSTTPASYDAMLVGFCSDWSGGAPTISSGWTDIGTGMAYSGTDLGRAEYRVYSSGSGQASFDGGNPCHVAHAFFIEGGGAPPSGPNLLTLLGVG